MATMYALPAATTWTTVGGWANTSGGASNGTYPGTTTDVIFDNNSGSARTISGAGSIASLNTTLGAPMTFSGSLQFNSSTGVDLTGTVSVASVVATGTSTFNFTVGGALLGSLACNSGARVQVLSGSAVTVTGAITVDSTNSRFYAAGVDTTCQSVSVAAAKSSGGFAISNATLTLTGTGTVWTNDAAAGETENYMAGSTIKITGGSASAITFNGASRVLNNFWNATTGAGGCTITGSNTFNNFRISAGATQRFTASTATTVTSLTADGTGSPITIDSTTTSAFGLVKAGGGTNYSDYISIAHCTGNPASTWYARNSTNGGTNTNWTFIPGNSKFLTFC